MRTGRHARCDGGFISVLVLMIIGVFAALSTAHFYSATMSLRQSKSQADVQGAALEAESGLEFLSYVISQQTLPGGATGLDLLDELASGLSDELDGTATLGGESISYADGQITIPVVVNGLNDRNFEAVIQLADGDDNVRLTVNGRSGGVNRTVAISFQGQPQAHPVFNYGFAARGPIKLENNTEIKGKNHPWEASLFSGASGTAFEIENRLICDGDIFAGDADAEVKLEANGTIGGTDISDPSVYENVHVGVGGADFPSMNPGLFEPYATNIVDSSTNTRNQTFENIRVTSGTNPDFAHTKLKGVVYIEKGNKVKFSQNTVLTGVIVTEEGDGQTDSIKFENKTDLYGLEDLSDDPKWEELKTLSGSMLLAPGFNVKFENRSAVFSGYLAAESFKFENNFQGEIKGGIISYGLGALKAENLMRVTIDRQSQGDGVPAGFVLPMVLQPQPGTYSEL